MTKPAQDTEAIRAAREAFLQRLRDALVQAINGWPITVADAWDILREWDRALGTAAAAPGETEQTP
jgi:hypothetical protein